MKQTIISTFFKAKKQDSSSDDSEPSQDGAPQQNPTKSAWTRVKSLQMMKTPGIQLYDLDKDIQQDLVLAQARGHIASQKGQVIWDPEDYNRKTYNWYLDQHALTEGELLAFGELATTARRRFELDPKLLSQIDPETVDEK
jgi:hypothetical protein